MAKLLGCLGLILMVIGGVWFARRWNRFPDQGESTGLIAKRNNVKTPDAAEKTRSTLQQIAEEPTRFKGQTKTVTGRVRDANKIASNRNMYTLIDGDARIMVIDDKPAPKPYYPRTVTGVVQVIGPPVGGLNYAYVTDVKSGVKVNPPSWEEVKVFFTTKYDDVRDEVNQQTQ